VYWPLQNLLAHDLGRPLVQHRGKLGSDVDIDQEIKTMLKLQEPGNRNE
jgi:hypothetical protein